jgi:hypothetical protein
MRYWHQREVSNRLRNDRLDRKEAREPFNDTQLAGGIGFHFDPPIEYDD